MKLKILQGRIWGISIKHDRLREKEKSKEYSQRQKPGDTK